MLVCGAVMLTGCLAGLALNGPHFPGTAPQPSSCPPQNVTVTPRYDDTGAITGAQIAPVAVQCAGSPMSVTAVDANLHALQVVTTTMSATPTTVTFAEPVRYEPGVRLVVVAYR